MSRANHVIVTADRDEGVSLLIASAYEAKYEFLYPDGGFIMVQRLNAPDARLLARCIGDAVTTSLTLNRQKTYIVAGKKGRVIIAQAGRRRILTSEDAKDVAFRLEGAANATVL